MDLAAAFLVGLLGSGHCVAMCGGIAAALDVAMQPGPGSRWGCRAGYQLGRIVSYAAAGAIAGGLGAGLFQLASTQHALLASRGLTAVMLVLLGLYLTGLWRAPLALVERAGGRLWHALAPLRKRVLPVRGPAGALRMGLLWGLLPCGLVYSALALALASGGPASGAATMLAFGAGTVPAVVLAGAAGGRLAAMAANDRLRRAAGALIIVAGLFMARGALAHIGAG